MPSAPCPPHLHGRARAGCPEPSRHVMQTREAPTAGLSPDSPRASQALRFQAGSARLDMGRVLTPSGGRGRGRPPRARPATRSDTEERSSPVAVTLHLFFMSPGNDVVILESSSSQHRRADRLPQASGCACYQDCHLQNWKLSRFILCVPSEHPPSAFPGRSGRRQERRRFLLVTQP